MSDFKIECDIGYSKSRYRIHRKEYTFFGFAHKWVEMASFDSVAEAEEALLELNKFPKYYSYGATT